MSSQKGVTVLLSYRRSGGYTAPVLHQITMRTALGLLAFSLLFPNTALCEIPVSPPTYTAAPGEQWEVKAASNGDIALAAWSDARGNTYATRIATDGTALDPLGIRLPGSGSEIVTWTGEDFLIITADENARIFTYVTVDGLVRLSRRLPARFTGLELFAEANGRLLFLQPHLAPNSLTILDYDGNPVSAAVALSPPSDGYRNSTRAVGGGPLGFLVLRREDSISTPVHDRVVAERFDFEGRRVSAVNTGITLNAIGTAQVVGHENGWYVVRQRINSDSRYVLERLDRDGVYTGIEVIYPPEGVHVTGAHLIIDGTRHVLAWQTTPDLGHAYVYTAEVLRDSGMGEARRTAQRVGIISDIELVAAGSHRLLLISANELFTSSSWDVTGHSLNERLEAGPRRMLTHSTTLQRKAEVAAGANGYLVAWGENGPDRFARLYVRRFSPSGEPQDPQPQVVHQFEQDFIYLYVPEVRIVSNGETYLLIWNVMNRPVTLARRMSALTGAWVDTEPVQVAAAFSWTIASNGSDALLASVEGCTREGAPRERCMSARRLNLLGELQTGQAEVISARRDYHDPSVASNGADYLVAWSEGFRECNTLCMVDPFSIEGVRVRANGSPIDPEPITMEGKRSGMRPTIAWDGTTYLVIWSTPGPREPEIRAARVTAEGAVSGVDPQRGGTPIGWGSSLLRAQAHGNSVVLLAEDGGWNMTTIPSGTPLEEIALLPRRPLVPAHTRSFGFEFGSLASVSRDGRLLIAYDRLGDGPSTGVPRVFLRFLDAASRRRAVARGLASGAQ